MNLSSSPRELIDVANIIQGLISYSSLVTSEEEFLDYHLKHPDFYVLIPANKKYFEFNHDDVFEISPTVILKAVYNHDKADYKGFLDSFKIFTFLKQFSVKDEFMVKVDEICAYNRATCEEIESLKIKNKRIGAFQTRNIPHLGHEQIIRMMLEYVDHLVLNPVVGPKISSDLHIEEYTDDLKSYFYKKYGDRVSILPVIANMFYAGPREAIHHAKLRQRLGFSHFVVGRDHAGSEGCYLPYEAPNVAKTYSNSFGIEIISHKGAAFCHGCGEIIIVGRCQHADEQMEEISGSVFREKLVSGEFYKYADPELQKHLCKIK